MSYHIVIKIPIDAIDDVDAREKTIRVLRGMNGTDNPQIDVKLQAIYNDKQPRGISLNLVGV